MRKVMICICLLFLLAAMAVPGLAAETVLGDMDASMPWTYNQLEPELYPVYFPETGWVPIYVYAEEGWYPLSVCFWSDDGGDDGLVEMKHLGGNWYQGLIRCDTTGVRFEGTGGENVTISLRVEPGVPVWFVIDTGWEVEISYDPLTTHLSFYTVYVQVPAGWDGVNIWGWDNYSFVEAFDGWPGPEMEYDGDRILAYTFNVPGWVDGLMFSTADGALQTENIFVDGYDKWIRITDNVNGEGKAICEVANFVPIEEQEPEETIPPTEPEDTGEPEPESSWEKMRLAIVIFSVAAGIVTLIAACIKQKRS